MFFDFSSIRIIIGKDLFAPLTDKELPLKVAILGKIIAILTDNWTDSVFGVGN